MKSVNEAGKYFPGIGRVFTATVTFPRLLKIDIVPRVTINGCIRRPTTIAPFSNPHASPIAHETSNPRGTETQTLASSLRYGRTAAVPNADNAKIAAMEISIPPAMITHVIPTAMIAYQDI